MSKSKKILAVILTVLFLAVAGFTVYTIIKGKDKGKDLTIEKVASLVEQANDKYVSANAKLAKALNGQGAVNNTITSSSLSYFDYPRDGVEYSFAMSCEKFFTEIDDNILYPFGMLNGILSLTGNDKMELGKTYAYTYGDTIETSEDRVFGSVYYKNNYLVLEQGYDKDYKNCYGVKPYEDYIKSNTKFIVELDDTNENVLSIALLSGLVYPNDSEAEDSVYILNMGAISYNFKTNEFYDLNYNHVANTLVEANNLYEKFINNNLNFSDVKSSYDNSLQYIAKGNVTDNINNLNFISSDYIESKYTGDNKDSKIAELFNDYKTKVRGFEVFKESKTDIKNFVELSKNAKALIENKALIFTNRFVHSYSDSDEKFYCAVIEEDFASLDARFLNAIKTKVNAYTLAEFQSSNIDIYTVEELGVDETIVSTKTQAYLDYVKKAVEAMINRQTEYKKQFSNDTYSSLLINTYNFNTEVDTEESYFKYDNTNYSVDNYSGDYCEPTYSISILFTQESQMYRVVINIFDFANKYPA